MKKLKFKDFYTKFNNGIEVEMTQAYADQNEVSPLEANANSF